MAHAGDCVKQNVDTTFMHMNDGSIIIDEEGKPLRKIESGAKGTLNRFGFVIWSPPIRDLTVSEAARFMSEQQRA